MQIIWDLTLIFGATRSKSQAVQVVILFGLFQIPGGCRLLMR
jgi:hypothetical protein